MGTQDLPLTMPFGRYHYRKNIVPILHESNTCKYWHGLPLYNLHCLNLKLQDPVGNFPYLLLYFSLQIRQKIGCIPK